MLRRLVYVLAALVAFAAAPVHAQDVQASVDRSIVRINESFTLVLRAEGAVRGEPEVAVLAPQFDIVNVSSSRRIAAPHAPVSAGSSTSRPSRPSVIWSAMPPTRVATTARDFHIASVTVSPKPSARLFWSTTAA